MILNKPTKSREYTKKIEIELSTRCILKCSECPRTMASNNTLEDGAWDSGFINPELIETLLLDDPTINLVHFCGAYGDPIYHPKLIEIVQNIHHKYRKTQISIETNGSGRQASWWKELGTHLNHNDSVTFSVDGLEDSNHIYRQDAQWDSILTAMKTLRDSFQGYMIWKWIIFRHNQHQPKQGMELAKSIGFNSFVEVTSGRYNDDIRPI